MFGAGRKRRSASACRRALKKQGGRRGTILNTTWTNNDIIDEWCLTSQTQQPNLACVCCVVLCTEIPHAIHSGEVTKSHRALYLSWMNVLYQRWGKKFCKSVYSLIILEQFKIQQFSREGWDFKLRFQFGVDPCLHSSFLSLKNLNNSQTPPSLFCCDR